VFPKSTMPAPLRVMPFKVSVSVATAVTVFIPALTAVLAKVWVTPPVVVRLKVPPRLRGLVALTEPLGPVAAEIDRAAEDEGARGGDRTGGACRRRD